MTQQLDFWKSDFGIEYGRRANNRIDSTNIRKLARDWGKILARANQPYPTSALEVGCNIGRNLAVLKNCIDRLHAVEPNAKVCQMLRENPDFSGMVFHEADGACLPYDDNSLDLVFTSGVLIHVAPGDLRKVVEEIHRVARHYIVCIEYFSHEPMEIPYHGKDGMLFKRDFGAYYLDAFPGLEVLDYGFLWERFDSSDNSNWWLFRKAGGQ